MSRRDAGSAFIETLIAAAIIAMTLGWACQAVAGGAARHRMAEARRTALLIAQSELAAVGSEIPLASGHTAGIEGGYVWEVDIAPYATAQSAVGALWKVSVAVRPQSGANALARLDTLRLGAAA